MSVIFIVWGDLRGRIGGHNWTSWRLLMRQLPVAALRCQPCTTLSGSTCP